MQLLCLNADVRVLLLCLLGAGPAVVWAATTSPQVVLPSADTSVQAKNLTPLEKMQSQVRTWVSQTNGGSPDEVQIAPIDSRMQVMPCERALWIDHPFASKETVRVRCPSVAGNAAQNANAVPVWQFYIRILSAGAAVNTAKSAGAANGPAVKMVVAKQLLPRGTLLSADMFQEVDTPTPANGQVDPAQLTSVKDVAMAELVRDLPAGTSVKTHDIRRAVLVKMGQQVLMTVGNGTDFQIRVRVEALQDGRMGEQVKLKNVESGKSMSGIVTGPNAVKGL